MANKDKRNLRKKKDDFNKRFSRLTLHESLGIIVNIKNRQTKVVIDTRLVHSMKDALQVLETAEKQHDNFFASLSSLSGDVRISTASSTKLGQSFLESAKRRLNLVTIKPLAVAQKQPAMKVTCIHSIKLDLM